MSDLPNIKKLARIEDIIGGYVELRPSGKDMLKGLCPFHKDSKPSLDVNTAKQAWGCFACGINGDVFDFLQRINGYTLRKAKQEVCDHYGIGDQWRESQAKRIEREKKGAAVKAWRTRIDENLRWLDWWAHGTLRDTPLAGIIARERDAFSLLCKADLVAIHDGMGNPLWLELANDSIMVRRAKQWCQAKQRREANAAIAQNNLYGYLCALTGRTEMAAIRRVLNESQFANRALADHVFRWIDDRNERQKMYERILA